MEDIEKNDKICIKKPTLKLNSDINQSSKKNVVWDYKQLEEQELEKKLNPKTKIFEPKTPYTGTVSNFNLQNYL